MWLLLVPLAADATPLVRWADTGDNAAALTRRAAEKLGATAEEIGAQGRLGNLPALHTDAEDLVRAATALDRFVQEEIE